MHNVYDYLAFHPYRIVEWVIVCCFGIGFAIAYQYSVVAESVMSLYPNTPEVVVFETTLVAEIILSIILFAALFSQLLFKVFVFLNLTQNSRNILSLKSVITLFVSTMIPIVCQSLNTPWIIVISILSFSSKYFALPLVILLDHEEAKTHFVTHNQSLLNIIPIVYQCFQWLQTKILQYFSLIKFLGCRDPR